MFPNSFQTYIRIKVIREVTYKVDLDFKYSNTNVFREYFVIYLISIILNLDQLFTYNNHSIYL